MIRYSWMHCIDAIITKWDWRIWASCFRRTWSFQPVGATQQNQLYKTHPGIIVNNSKLISKLIMWQVEKREIQSHITTWFLEAVSKYQSYVEELAQIDFSQELLPRYSLRSEKERSNINNNKYAIHLITDGPSFKVSICLRTVRGIHTDNLTIILAFDEYSRYKINKYAILVVLHPREAKDAGIARKWRDQYCFNMVLTIRQPFKRQISDNYFIVRLENVVIQEGKRFRQSSDLIKEKANLCFKSRKYIEALILYEMALSNSFQESKRRERSILYSNSSACLYQMRLYKLSLAYAELAIKLDSTYSKGFYRKINSLLELQLYKLGPSCLLKLSTMINKEEFEQLNMKFSNYVANEIGIYNWKELVNFNSSTNNAFAVGQFTSEKIEKRSVGNQQFYYAKADINAYELIIVNKPLVYALASSTEFKFNFESFMSQVTKYSRFQKQFYEDFLQLPCNCHPKGMSTSDHLNSSDQYEFDPKQLTNKLQRCISIERNLQVIENDIYYGLWKRLFMFQQNCIPNCSYIHLKSVILVFSFKKIKEGEILSIDILSDEEIEKRQDTMKLRFGMGCSCHFCAFEWSRAEFKVPSSSNIMKSGNSIQIKKQLMWNIIFRKFNKAEDVDTPQFYDLIVQYSKLVEEQASWESVINIVRLFRDCFDLELKRILQQSVKKLIKIYFKFSGIEIYMFMRRLFIKDIV